MYIYIYIYLETYIYIYRERDFILYPSFVLKETVLLTGLGMSIGMNVTAHDLRGVRFLKT